MSSNNCTLLIFNKDISENNLLPHHKNERVCYVCLRKSYQEISQKIKEVKKIVFVDVVSSKLQNVDIKNEYVLLDNPENLETLKTSILQTVRKNKCNVIIIDDLSDLLLYQNKYSILKFSHEILNSPEYKQVSKILLIREEYDMLKERNKELKKDITMFADKIKKMNSP